MEIIQQEKESEPIAFPELVHCNSCYSMDYQTLVIWKVG